MDSSCHTPCHAFVASALPSMSEDHLPLCKEGPEAPGEEVIFGHQGSSRAEQSSKSTSVSPTACASPTLDSHHPVTARHNTVPGPSGLPINVQVSRGGIP
jgi:hypothetical protein